MGGNIVSAMFEDLRVDQTYVLLRRCTITMRLPSVKSTVNWISNVHTVVKVDNN
jgi:hypothetical protein